MIDKFEFKYLPQDVSSLYGYDNNHSVILSPTQNNMKLVKLHDDTFLLHQLYSNYGDLIQELIIKKRIAGKEYLKVIKNMFIGIPESEIKRLAFGNYFEKHEFGKRPLAKFMNDIAKDIKLI